MTSIYICVLFYPRAETFSDIGSSNFITLVENDNKIKYFEQRMLKYEEWDLLLNKYKKGEHK